jgi:exonuclease SbcD
MRFLHCSDVHLDSPLKGLDRYVGAPVDEVRGATRRAFENMVQLALRERVDFVVIAGDLYDGDWPDFNTGLFFARGMAQLGESGIAAYVLRGNHDAASKLTRSLPLPRNVHLLPDREPGTLIDENLGLAVHGQSFATAAVFDDLAAQYPLAVPGYFNLGVLHTSLTGRAGHHSYAPTTEGVLRTKGYDYWALGHVHAREIVSREPWIVYPGNIQGRHIREQGPKGCELVTVSDGCISIESAALDVLRWSVLTLDIAGLPDLDALFDQAARVIRAEVDRADTRFLGARIRILGAGPLHTALCSRPEAVMENLRAVAIEASGGTAWLEKVEVQARPVVDLARLAQGDDPIALLLREIRGHAQDEGRLKALADEALRELRGKLPPDLEDDGPLRLDTAETLCDLLGEAESELLARLVGQGGQL